MAKPENPAEAPVAARPPRPLQRVRLDMRAEIIGESSVVAEGASPDAQRADAGAAHAKPSGAGQAGVERHAARDLIDDAFDVNTFDVNAFDAAAFDTARNLEVPDGFLAEEGFDPEAARESSAEYALPEDDGYDAEAVRIAPVAARNASVEPRPGLAYVRRHVSGSWAPQPANGASPSSGAAGASASRVPKLPVASLERPSTSRLELTPSPVPRVALAPATGAVDISLVPGPHTIGSRNLPTLAAQHLLGRRAPRRPAPAVTVPPPSSREPRSAFTLARDVRSSKGEIVLGLTIGLGVSLLLAGLGQAYLRGDVTVDESIADASKVDGSSAPVGLESVTLSARPDVTPAGSSTVAPSGALPASRAASGDAASGARTATAAAIASGRTASSAAVPRDAAARDAVAPTVAPTLDAVMLAQATVARRMERTPQRATPARATRPRHAQRAESVPAASALDSSAAHQPASAPALAAPSEPPPASAPLTPAESAGLGLDLPL